MVLKGKMLFPIFNICFNIIFYTQIHSFNSFFFFFNLVDHSQVQLQKIVQITLKIEGAIKHN